MSRILVAYLATLVVFCVLDFVWLGFLARNFYRAEIGTLLLETPKWGVAIFFYALYVAGITLFVVLPALGAGSLLRVVVMGALFGLVCYATYDLTNLATLRGWTLRMAAVDIAWGMVLTAASATAGVGLTRALVPA